MLFTTCNIVAPAGFTEADLPVFSSGVAATTGLGGLAAAVRTGVLLAGGVAEAGGAATGGAGVAASLGYGLADAAGTGDALGGVDAWTGGAATGGTGVAVGLGDGLADAAGTAGALGSGVAWAGGLTGGVGAVVRQTGDVGVTTETGERLAMGGEPAFEITSESGAGCICEVAVRAGVGLAGGFCAEATTSCPGKR